MKTINNITTEYLDFSRRADVAKVRHELYDYIYNITEIQKIIEPEMIKQKEDAVNRFFNYVNNSNKALATASILKTLEFFYDAGKVSDFINKTFS